jgi:arylsulfatase A-like enzyme
VPRRQLPRLVAFAAIATAVSVGPYAAAPEARAQDAAPPNILIILTDDQRGPGTIAVMPEVAARFRDGGTSFANGYAATPLCCPSRATLMTGRLAHNTGVRTNGDAVDLNQASTLQRYLRQNGYWTGIYGKYLNRWDLTKAPPHFDRYAIFNPTGYFKQHFNSNGNQITVNKYATDFIATRADTFLAGAEARDDAQPWLLMLNPNAPHSPYVPAPRHAKAAVPAFSANPAVLEADRSDKPAYVRAQFQSLGEAKSIRTRQLRMLMSVDDLVERTFDALERHGEAGNTLAVYVSDNGFVWREHGLSAKTLPYTHSVRVPFYVWGSGVGIPAGITDAVPVTIADIMPTVLAQAGITPDATFPVDGRSLLSGLSRDRAFLEFFQEKPPGPRTTPDWASIRTAAYQYVEYYDPSFTTVIVREYYDLVGDPWQNHNLLGDADPFNDPDVSALSAQLAHDRDCSGTSGDAACP